MRKRIMLLVVALMMALSMSFSATAFANPPFTKENPGGQAQGCQHNKNCKTINRGGQQVQGQKFNSP